MKLFIAIILSASLFACRQTPKKSSIRLPPENSTTHIIKLVDSLGDVTIELPVRYDTIFTWTHEGDCGKSCDEIKYRFQPKQLPIIEESGWFWYVLKDSVEQFTISHSGYFPFHEMKGKSKDSSFMFVVSKHNKEQIVYTDTLINKSVSDSVEKIGDRYFSVVTISFYDTTKRQYSKKLWATATIKNNIIDFKFELLTKEKDSLKDNFIENAKYYLRTIRLNKGI